MSMVSSVCVHEWWGLLNTEEPYLSKRTHAKAITILLVVEATRPN